MYTKLLVANLRFILHVYVYLYIYTYVLTYFVALLTDQTDKASMLDEVIEYLKQLQAQVQMMSRMNMQPAAMMLPMTMQQLPMPMMAQMGMGMGMGFGMGTMGVDMNNTNHRSNITGGISPHVLHPTHAAFMPIASWPDASSDRFQATSHAAVIPDPLSTFLSCQSQVKFSKFGGNAS